MKKIEIYDTTLRDGAQTEGISFSVNDKLRITEKLDELGVHFIEGGWPGANPKDISYFHQVKKIKLVNARIAAFGSTKRSEVKPENDIVLKGLIASKANVITIFGKAWDLQVKDVLKTSLDENLKMIEASVKYLKSNGKFVLFDAEHFFDGYIANRGYALKALKAAQNGGADRIVLCDTNGGTITSTVFNAVIEAGKEVKTPLGIHVHNDCELAVANSIAAVEAGAIHVQGTMNGYGERCGNANLASIIPILKLKLGIDCISDIALKELTETSRFVAEICNMKQEDSQPFVGSRAFAHKAGIHVNAILKNSRSYEHVAPEKVGNKRRLVVSEQAGRSSIKRKAEELNIKLDTSKDQEAKILNSLKKLESEGYQFESAEASLELFMNRSMKKFKDFFQMQGFRVITEKKGRSKVETEATVSVKVGEHKETMLAHGDGPVNALDSALRKALKDFFPSLNEMHLSDFKVRVLDEKSATAAKVRVLIKSQDKHDSWWTIGVSENIIEASWKALIDSVEYKLFKDSKS
ncbi:MAG: citramalate synthase [Candidatus Omnitrophica bacterium]|nr:citramalate synthase [Candidatus Omnitrophota bacterium]